MGKEKSSGLSKNDLRIGSVLRDSNGIEHKVIRFKDGFIITTYGNGENWLVPWHLKWEELVRY